jgi:putative ABC transport system permease protein
VYRVLQPQPSAMAAALGPSAAWLPAHVPDMLLSREAAERMRVLAPVVVATYRSTQPLRAAAGDAYRSVGVRVTTQPLFAVFARRFVAGAAWDASADDAADARVAVITDTAARRWFGHADAVGRSLDLDGVSFSVVGVIARDPSQPYDLRYWPDADELFVPWAQGAALSLAPESPLPAGGFVHVSAAGDVAPLAGAAQLLPLDEFWERARSRDPAVLMLAVLAFAALGGCTLNLTRLLVAKGVSDRAPSSIRRAIGARRVDVFVMKLFESLLVGLGAGAVSLLLAWVGAAAFNALLPARPADYELNLRLAAVNFAVALAAGLVAGVWPSLQASRVAPATQLRNV